MPIYKAQHGSGELPALKYSGLLPVVALSRPQLLSLSLSLRDAAIQHIQQRRVIGGTFSAGIVMTRLMNLSTLAKEVVPGAWDEYRIEQIDSTSGNWMVFLLFLADGMSVSEMKDDQIRVEIGLRIEEAESKS